MLFLFLGCRREAFLPAEVRPPAFVALDKRADTIQAGVLVVIGRAAESRAAESRALVQPELAHLGVDRSAGAAQRGAHLLVGGCLVVLADVVDLSCVPGTSHCCGVSSG